MQAETLETIKRKYWTKTLTPDAILITWQRSIDVRNVFARITWLQVSAFDLSQLGIGLLNNIAPADMEPYNIERKAELPELSFMLQGIWMLFEPVDITEIYPWTASITDFIKENVTEEYQPQLLIGIGEKAYYDKTLYGYSLYDPVVAREFLRATAHRFRAMKTSDKVFNFIIQQMRDYLEMTECTSDVIYNRIMIMMAAQSQTFLLGFSILGISKLTHVENGTAEIQFEDARGNLRTAKISSLDQMQFGMILGIAPLGYGVLLPKKSIYKLPEGKKNPPVIEALFQKIKGLTYKLGNLCFAYGNYNKPEEMTDFFRSQRTCAYGAWHALRRDIENWILNKIKDVETNPILIRQYQNAILQYISWKAKRHKWGYKLFEKMSETQFYYWWLQYWESQGLKRATLQALYEGCEIWIQAIRERKIDLWKQIQQTRKQLALLT